MANIKIKNKEGRIEKAILEYLSYKKEVFAWKNHTTGIYRNDLGKYIPSNAKAGASDILGVIKGGRFLAIEVKSGPLAKVSDAQKKFIEDINKKGGVAMIAWSIDMVKENLILEGCNWA